MLEGLNGTIDLIIPRGGKGLTGRVMAEARVPVLAHLEGLCHVYVHAKADLAKARSIALNAKMRRTCVCGAAETLLIDRAILKSHGVPMLEDLAEGRLRNPRRRGGARGLSGRQARHRRRLEDRISRRHHRGEGGGRGGTRRSAISNTMARITPTASSPKTQPPPNIFSTALDSAIVLWNASTQFADGGEFGMGAEIGIGTGKMHARGPVGVEQLTTFKYVVRGTGQMRP